jgi:hypothetical protein
MRQRQDLGNREPPRGQVATIHPPTLQRWPREPPSGARQLHCRIPEAAPAAFTIPPGASSEPRPEDREAHIGSAATGIHLTNSSFRRGCWTNANPSSCPNQFTSMARGPCKAKTARSYEPELVTAARSRSTPRPALESPTTCHWWPRSTVASRPGVLRDRGRRGVLATMTPAEASREQMFPYAKGAVHEGLVCLPGSRREDDHASTVLCMFCPE